MSPHSRAHSSSNNHIFIITGHLGCDRGQRGCFSLMGGAVSLRITQQIEGEINTRLVAQGKVEVTCVLFPVLDSASPTQGLAHAPLPGEREKSPILFNSHAFSLPSYLVLHLGCLNQTSSLMPGFMADGCPLPLPMLCAPK